MTLPDVAPLDSDLIERIRAGDEDAFEQLFRRYYRELCLYAARIDGSLGTGEEIVQEVFFRIWTHRDRLIVTSSLAGYLYTAVRNYALNQRARAQTESRYRAAQLLEALATPTESPQADEALRTAEMASAIDRAIAQLPPRCRQAFVLRRQHHLSYAEIARIMQIAPKTVEIQIGNALKVLRRELEDWMG
jgi:RNA polymerase sigma-70 factor (ECF subfamily)